MDNNYISWAEENGTIAHLDDIIPPEGISDTLKFSNSKNMVVTAKKVIGGAEDVVDINRGENISVIIDEAIPTGKYVCTIKGGVDNSCPII